MRKLLFIRDFKIKEPSQHKDDTGIRTLTIILVPAFGFYVEINYGITILLGCIQINFLE